MNIHYPTERIIPLGPDSRVDELEEEGTSNSWSSGGGAPLRFVVTTSARDYIFGVSDAPEMASWIADIRAEIAAVTEHGVVGNGLSTATSGDELQSTKADVADAKGAADTAAAAE